MRPFDCPSRENTSTVGAAQVKGLVHGTDGHANLLDARLKWGQKQTSGELNRMSARGPKTWPVRLLRAETALMHPVREMQPIGDAPVAQ
jgi:hypothetical protein